MNELVVKGNSGAPTEHEMMVYHTMAEQAESSKMYKGIGDKSGIMMIMLAARELGIPPVQALNGGINIINGKVEISARMMSALIRKSGHQISIKENTDYICTLKGTRSDTGEIGTVSYTFAEAQKAGLVKSGGGWFKCPKDMVFARAMSRLARQLFSDVIGMGYIEGEIKATEAVVCVPDDIPQEEAIEVNPEELINLFLSLFEEEDKQYAAEYLRAIMGHFQWTMEKAVAEVIKDKEKLIIRFRIWREAQIEKAQITQE